MSNWNFLLIFLGVVGDAEKQAGYHLVLVRHGESEYGSNNLFAGWMDSDLSYKGECQSANLAKKFIQYGFQFDIAFTSVLKRSIKTCQIVLDMMGLHWIPVHKSWRLNERMYGMLQGCNKSKTAAQYGQEQVQTWRRAWDGTPPPLTKDDINHPIYDPKYKLLHKSQLPDTESFKDSSERVLPFWHDTIVPAIKEGNRVLVVAHGSTIRALIKHLDKISPEGIKVFEIVNCVPLVYELDENMESIRHYFLECYDTLKKDVQDIKNEIKQNPKKCS